MAHPFRPGDIVALDDARHVLITSLGGASYGDAHGFIIGTTDPTDQAEVRRDATPAGRITARTARTQQIAEHMTTTGYRPSQLPAINAELAAAIDRSDRA